MGVQHSDPPAHRSTKADASPSHTCSASWAGLQKLRFKFFITAIVIVVYASMNRFSRNYTMRDADTSEYTQSIFLPFIHDIHLKPEEMPCIRASVNGTEIDMPVDTGSTGLLIGAPLLPDVDANQGIPAYQFFTSSRILYTGRQVELPIVLHGLRGSSATAVVPVLVVDESVVCPWYDPDVDTFTCPYNPDKPKPKLRDTSKITYMGVGFGRNKVDDKRPNAVPKGNPFLNVRSIDGETISPGSMRVGYTVSTKGVHLGLTEKSTRDFVFVRLRPGATHDEDPRDWAMIDVCFSLDGKETNCGSALIDTGISQMYLRTEEGVDIPTVWVPNPNPNGAAKRVRRAKPGTRIDIWFPSAGLDKAAEYSFRVGEGKSMEPAYVVPEKQRSPPYVNTGRNFLCGYSVAFDAQAGRFGFRPARTSSSL